MPYIRNSHSSTIQVAGMYWDPQACGHWYAESDDGLQWPGRYGPVYTYLYPFDSCLQIGSTAAWKTVTMKQHDQELYPGGLNIRR
jgi:hypothetical protein